MVMKHFNFKKGFIDGYTKIVYNFVKNGGQLIDKDVETILMF